MRAALTYVGAVLMFAAGTARAQHMEMSMPMPMAPEHRTGGTAPAPDATRRQRTHRASSALPANDHRPPRPPMHALPAMPRAAMEAMMQMDDRATRGGFLLDRLESQHAVAGERALAWEAEAWWGDDIDRAWFKGEGEHVRGGTGQARAEALWSHAVDTFWNLQLGLRHDFGGAPSRDWLAAGMQGLAPYWFELQATFYAGPQGRAAFRFEASRDLLFTQRLILQARLETDLYGQDDAARGIRRGLSNLEAGLRLRYEISRRFAPYVGVAWSRRFASDRFASDAPGSGSRLVHETTWLAGVRLWF